MTTGTTRNTRRARTQTGTMTIGTAMAAATTVIGTEETTATGTTTATEASTATKVTTTATATTVTGRVGNNDNWKKYGNDHDGNDDNGHWKGGNNDNWKKGDHDVNENWSKNGYQHWSQNHKNYGNGWSGYHNNWNKNWDRRAYVRNWSSRALLWRVHRLYFLLLILAANGVGVVPYAPEPYLCWYWADPQHYLADIGTIATERARLSPPSVAVKVSSDADATCRSIASVKGLVNFSQICTFLKRV